MKQLRCWHLSALKVISDPMSALARTSERDGRTRTTNENCTANESWTRTKYTYDSFGKLTASTGSLVNPFRYTARESDTETGLYYYRARYYDPASGRFLSEDPLQFYGGGANFYRYAFNSSANLNDPSGLAPSLLDRLLDRLKPTHAPPKPCAPKFNCDPDGYRDADPYERGQFLAQAAAFNGTPYLYGGKTPDAFDCSGFVCWVVQHSGNDNFPWQGTGTR